MSPADVVPTSGGAAYRLFAWGMIAILAAYIVNNYLINWHGIPSLAATFGGGEFRAASLIVPIVYGGALAISFVSVARRDVSLRDESDRLHRLNLYLVRAAFWGMLLVGFADAIISFLRVEGFLPAVFGDALAGALGKSQWRGSYVHLPLVAAGAVLALFTRTIGFHWFALMVVVAELLIVIGRFVFSYEQTFMSDLVRLWYAALFLFSSAYTLYEDGHVRVDIAYAGFSDVTKGWVNAIGSLLLGVALCWVILLVSLNDKTSIVNAALLRFETSQSGFGMYIKYWMASFLAVFGITMLIQFISYFLESVADIRREPGKREVVSESAH
jgi:TRAP-type mannitol/chloroaromatic compound transport system permease small subunit